MVPYRSFRKLQRTVLKVPKTCHVAVSKPNRNSLQGLEASYLDAKVLVRSLGKLLRKVLSF